MGEEKDLVTEILFKYVLLFIDTIGGQNLNVYFAQIPVRENAKYTQIPVRGIQYFTRIPVQNVPVFIKVIFTIIIIEIIIITNISFGREVYNA